MQFRVGQRFLRRCASKVRLDLSEADDRAVSDAKDLAVDSWNRMQRNKSKTFDLDDVRRRLKSYGVDLPQNPTDKDVSRAWLKYYEQRPDVSSPEWDPFYAFSRELISLGEKLEQLPDTIDELIQQYEEQAKGSNEAYKGLAEKVLAQVEAAAQRADVPSNIPVTLSSGGSSSFTVEFNRGVNFTLFVNSDTGKIEQVEDVLEGGDMDFFHGPQGPTIAKVYFDLIKEIQHPGSSQTGKDILLYTARPVKDRRQFEGARTLPPNLFLANSLDHVEGLATDLGSERRDVWKVRINTKHLVLTNDAGRVKYYQIVGDKPVPVQNLELIIPAED